jgi:hypothetical protein
MLFLQKQIREFSLLPDEVRVVEVQATAVRTLGGRESPKAGRSEAWLKLISPQVAASLAWRNVHLIGNFDFTTASSEVDIEALAARYQNEDFWRRSMTEVEDEGPQW